MKTCSKCRESKPLDQFSRMAAARDGIHPSCKVCKATGNKAWSQSTAGRAKRNAAARARYAADPAPYREKRRQWGIDNPEKQREAKRRAMAANPEKYRALKRTAYSRMDPGARRAIRLGARFNLTLEEYAAIVECQDGRCAICRTDQPGGRWGTLVVDHDHDTGAVRGLLCNSCNIAIGLMPEPHRLLAAAEYVTQSAAKLEVI